MAKPCPDSRRLHEQRRVRQESLERFREMPGSRALGYFDVCWKSCLGVSQSRSEVIRTLFAAAGLLASSAVHILLCGCCTSDLK